MANNNEHSLVEDRMAELHGLSYAEIEQLILAENEAELSPDVVISRINTVRKETRLLQQECTLTEREYLTPFTI